MMFGFIPISFRFRGKSQRLMRMYQCFADHTDVALHPAQISRQSGIRLAEVNDRLQATPELFVKLPRRKDGITRYRLTSATSSKTPEEVATFIASAARKESWLLYAVGTMVLCIMAIVLILITPAV